MRVVMRRKTIEPVRSERSHAARAMSKASCESEGSSVTARANFCSTRLSCSFYAESTAGSNTVYNVTAVAIGSGASSGSGTNSTSSAGYTAKAKIVVE